MKKDYSSPRWSQEILDCSMPMSFDTYSVCSYNCLYCFSFFQKSHCVRGYNEKEVRSVDPEKVKNIFEAVIQNNPELTSKEYRQFTPYIQKKIVMQWGGLSDPFDEFEKRHGITLELLEYFDKIDYPLSFSTKAVWWTKDERYMNLFKKHKHNWHVKISIITLNEKQAKVIELGCPKPEERLQAIKNLSDIGIHVTLRLRPFIIGCSDNYVELINKAADAGADSVSTEFFCLDSRANEQLKERYKKMSSVLGFDVHKYYMEHSKQSGYKRLNKAMKTPIIKKMSEIAHSRGMRFNVSDAFCRDYNDHCNCCGVPPEWLSQTNHFGKAVLIAKEKGEVRFSDIAKCEEIFDFRWYAAANFNTRSLQHRAEFFDITMFKWIRLLWNKVESGRSLAKAYGNILIPSSRDENGDIVYKYIGDKNDK